jgi:multiple sugar transport system permease protein
MTAHAPSLKRQKRIGRAILYTALTVFGLFFVFPIVFMLVSSIKPESLVARDMSGLMAFVPRQSTLDNYRNVFFEMPFLRYMFNSIVVVASIVSLGIIVNSMLAYSLSRLRWKGRDIVLALVVSLMIIPFEAIAVPLLLEVNSFGWIDTYHVQIIPLIAFPLYIFLFYQFFIGIPAALDTAAMIDGAGSFTIYLRIILPLSKPAIATVAILNFIHQWSNYLWPLMVTRSDAVRPLPVAMGVFFGLQPRLWGSIMAFAALITIPVLILFLVFQRWFVRSVASSGVKG